MPPRGITTDRAFVVSIHDDGCQGMLCRVTLHINLKWHGNHDISDFDLDQLGKVMQCETETETSGWVVVQQTRVVNSGYAIPLRMCRDDASDRYGLVRRQQDAHSGARLGNSGTTEEAAQDKAPGAFIDLGHLPFQNRS